MCCMYGENSEKFRNIRLFIFKPGDQTGKSLEEAFKTRFNDNKRLMTMKNIW
jgi:hypothetical protein